MLWMLATVALASNWPGPTQKAPVSLSVDPKDPAPIEFTTHDRIFSWAGIGLSAATYIAVPMLPPPDDRFAGDAALGSTLDDWGPLQMTFEPSKSAKGASDLMLYGGGAVPMFLPMVPKEGWSRRHWQRAGIISEAFTVSYLATTATKMVVRRPRPYARVSPDAFPVTETDSSVYDQTDLYGGPCDTNCTFEEADAFWSFPSGHTSSVSATWTAWATLATLSAKKENRWKVAIPTYAAAASMGIVTGHLRVRAGKHHPSDVMSGFALGTASGILVPLAHKW